MKEFTFLLTISRKLPATFNTVFMALSDRGITMVVETYFAEWAIYVGNNYVEKAREIMDRIEL